jgi:beta-lactamase regulating signal transducer with metallopeptidase domain
MKGSLVDWLLSLTPMQSPLYAMYSWLIHTTVYLTITALFIILFKLIFKNRLKAKWHFLIWAVLLIRFIVSVFPSSPVSIFNTVKVDEGVIEKSSYQTIVTPSDNEAVAPDDIDSAKQTPYSESNGFVSVTTGPKPGESVTIIIIDRIVLCIWLGGTVILLGYFITVFTVYKRRLKKIRRECDESALLDKCKNTLNIKRDVRLYYADTTPMLIGLFKPSIYVPEGLSEAEFEATLLHELNHMKHLDVLWSAIATFVLCVNWFNPIIWFSFFMFKRDLEVYCDERTLIHTENKQNYAMLLLKTATARKERFVLGTTSLQSGKADVKRRIRFMANFKKPSVVLVLIAVVLVGLLTTACLTNPVGKDTSTNTNNTAQILPQTDYEHLYADRSFQAFRSKQTLDELKQSVLYQQPEDFIIVKETDSEFLVRWGDGADFLYSKEVYGQDDNLLDDVFVVAVEEKWVVDNSDELNYPFPYHMTKRHWTLSEAENGYSLSNFDDDPFVSAVQLKPSASVFTELVNYYQDHSCEVRYEGDNLTGGIIFVTFDEPYNETQSQFRILVTKDGDNFYIRYRMFDSAETAYPETVIRRYMNAVNEKDKESFVSCFKEIDKRLVDNFISNVKSCSFQNTEIFWIDKEQEYYIFKVTYRLISEDGKVLGAYGTGKMDLVEYWTVSTNTPEHEPVILNKLKTFSDCVHELYDNQE